MISIPCELNEMLRQAYQVDADSTSLLRRLAAAVEDYFDAEEEEREAAVQSEEPSENDLADQYEDGRKHGLETARSIIEAEEDAIHQKTADAKLTKTVLARIVAEIEMAEACTSLEYDPPDEGLGSEGLLEELLPKDVDRELVCEQPRVMPRIVLMALFPSVGDTVSRKDAIKALRGSGAGQSVTSNTIANSIKAKQLIERPDKMLERVL